MKTNRPPATDAGHHRSGYLRMREEVRMSIYSAVFVSDLTRLGRDADEAFDFIRACSVHDVPIVINGEVLDTSRV